MEWAAAAYGWDIVLMGLIWSVALGFAAGNYACSLVHRLPRGRGILEKKPYCGHCGTMLATKDLFPVISAILLRHQCRYCGTAFPASHTWTELAIGAIFCVCFLRFGFSEPYFLISCIGSFLVVLTCIHHNEGGLVERRVMIAAAVAGVVLRTLADGNLFGFFAGGLYGLLIGAVIWRKSIVKVGHVYALPLPALLLALGGVITGDKLFLFFLAAYAAFAAAFWLLDKAFRKTRRMTIVLPFTLAVMTVLLFF